MNSDQHHLGLSPVEPNASGQSWNSALHRKGKWKGPLAAKPIDWSDESDQEVETVPIRTFIKAKTGVDYVVLDEITEVVKYESMNLVDNLILTTTREAQD